MPKKLNILFQISMVFKYEVKNCISNGPMVNTRFDLEYYIEFRGHAHVAYMRNIGAKSFVPLFCFPK
jgi:hypothetical protein